MNKISIFSRMMLIALIRLYQKTLSFDHSFLKVFYPHGYCRFHPTCSEYSIQAITKYGAFKGGFIASKRIARCNPFNNGGYDPLK